VPAVSAARMVRRLLRVGRMISPAVPITTTPADESRRKLLYWISYSDGSFSWWEEGEDGLPRCSRGMIVDGQLVPLPDESPANPISSSGESR
jgi:hypothetical protein